MATTGNDALRGLQAGVAVLVREMEALRQKNWKEHAFQPKFWMQHADFTLARDVFVASCGSIEHEATKFSLLYAKTNPPSTEDATSICKALREPIEQLLAATKVALFSGVGPSLAECILQIALRVLKSVGNIVATALKKEHARVPEMAGRVWECCKSVQSLPKSNCIATKRSMLECVVVVKDTLEELTAFLSDAAAAESEEADLDDEFVYDDHLSDEDKELFASGVQLLEMLATVLKRGVLSVKKLIIEEGQDDLISWAASLDIAFREVHTAIVDMGAALYPPVDTEDLNEALESVERTGSAILRCLLDRPSLEEEESEALNRGVSAFNKQVRQVRKFLQPHDTSAKMKYSLWLVPDDEASSKLQSTIDDLAGRLETPTFAPHMTLLGGVEATNEDDVVKKTEPLAKILSKLSVEVDTVAAKDLYFQCVFALLKKTPDLDAPYLRACEAFERLQDASDFMPHISLLYGDLSPQLRTDIRTEMTPHWTNAAMTMTRLQVWTTTGPVATWQRVADFPLQ